MPASPFAYVLETSAVAYVHLVATRPLAAMSWFAVEKCAMSLKSRLLRSGHPGPLRT